MYKREYGDYIEDIVDAMDKAMQFTENMNYSDFIHDNKTIFAVIRALEIIGEAVKKIPEDVRTKNPEIPWKRIAGMRDKVIHEYFGVKLEVVWMTVKEEIPTLRPLFQNIPKK